MVPVNPVARADEIYAHAGDRTRSDRQDELVTVDVEKVYKCRVRGIVACETAAHREYVARPLAEQRMTPRPVKGEMAIENPGRRGGEQE